MTPFYKTIFFDLGNTLVTRKEWVPGGFEALTELNRQGFKLGIISNTGTWNRIELLTQLPVDFSFDFFVNELILLSSEIGLEKPDPAIFQLALERAHAWGPYGLFCTEDLRDTLVAQQAGLHAIRLHNPPNGDFNELVHFLQSI
jgi:putative hydrolase of the HAD superfamily